MSSSHYSDVDEQRYVDEPTSRTGRTPFGRDRARVLHSAGLRRLAQKTQVVRAGESDFLRTRLTHTLEVAQIARELGSALGTDPDLADTAALAHDLGHPPFGHNGEQALDELCADIGGFEGNAQSFRLLTRLETKAVDSDGQSVGLNLTRASLDGVIKYPWPRRSGTPKFNTYADDRPIFDWVRQGAVEGRRCIEAQVMDWSDDVAYSVHDVEDGVHAGHLDLRVVHSPAERAAVCELAKDWYEPETSIEELSAALDRIITLPVWSDEFDQTAAGLRSLKAMTSYLIGRFVRSAYDATRAIHGDAPLTRFDGDLTIEADKRHEVSVLKALSNLFVFQRENAEVEYRRQREGLADLVHAVTMRAPESLDVIFAELWDQAANDAERRRVVIDQIACLTDGSVSRWHDTYC